MFIEPFINKVKDSQEMGWIEVISGCMFSGKTEELIRRLNHAILADKKTGIFKPAIDTRYNLDRIVSHNKSFLQCTSVNFAKDILQKSESCNVVGIDEAQFFDNAIIDVCNTLANNGKRVIVAGLDMDFEGKPFGPMPGLLAIAEFVTKVHAICAQTGEPAAYSFRLTDNEQQFMLGEKDKYEARSRKAFLQGMKNRK